MSAVSKGHIEGPRNALVRCASFLIGSVGFGLSVLAALLHLLYTQPPVPDIAEQKNSPSTRSPRKHEKQLSVSSSNASTLVPTTPRSNSINSKLKFQPSSPDASLEEKQILEEQVVLVTEPKDDLDSPTTLVDSPGTISSEEFHTDDSCRAKDPSRKCNGKCLFKVLRKTPSAPSSLSPTSCVSPAHKKKSQPRLRTMPYDAPFFLPTPDSLPPRPVPSRSQTSPPPLRPKATRSQSVFLEKSASSETETPRSPKHVAVLLPPATARHS